MRHLLSAVLCLGVLSLLTVAATAAVFEAGGDRLIEMQNADGGWAWPLGPAASATNTAGPIGMGLVTAYVQTGDSKYLDAAVEAGDFIKSVAPPHATGDGVFVHALSQLTGNDSYANYVKMNYYGALEAGVYVGKNGITYDSAGYAQYILDLRASQGIGNLGTWDVALAAVGAHRLGAETAPWVQAIKAGIESINGNAYYDVIGLSGGLWALAEIGVEFNPTAGAYASAESLADLATILAGYQLTTGGFTWNSNYVIENDDNETIQETAYAILALNAYDRDSYSANIAAASAYLVDVQLVNGGWKGWAGGVENNEITGEALWAIGAAVPEPTTLLIWTVLGVLGAVAYSRRK